MQDPYANQFLYIPTHEEGVIIGSSQSEKYPKAIWSFENLDLAEENCLIRYLNEQMLYVIQDLSYQFAQTSMGTWVSLANLVSSDFDWLNLHEIDHFRREFRISQGSTIIDLNFSEDTEQTISSLKQWCNKHELHDYTYIPIFDKMNIKTVHDLHSLDLTNLHKILKQIFPPADE